LCVENISSFTILAWVNSVGRNAVVNFDTETVFGIIRRGTLQAVLPGDVESIFSAVLNGGASLFIRNVVETLVTKGTVIGTVGFDAVSKRNTIFLISV